MRKKLLLLFNPFAGKGKAGSRLFEMVGKFDSHGYSVTAVPTRPGEEIFDQIRDETPGMDMIVTVGGDGTLDLTVNGMLRNGIDLPLGYIPLGSTNDFGESLGLSKNILKACDAIVNGTPHPTDIGMFNGRYFVYIACAGMFAEASYNTPAKMKKVLGHSAYMITGLSTAPVTSKKSSVYRVETDEGVIEMKCIFVSASNSYRAGGVLNLPKEGVSLHDGKFELLMVAKPKNIIDGAVMIKDALHSSFYKDDFVFVQSSHFRITTEKPFCWSLDGESSGECLEADISVVPGAIKFVY